MSDEQRAPIDFGPANLRLKEIRGEAITMFAEVESRVDSLIAIHYAKHWGIFMWEVAADEHFSWALRRSLFEKVARAREVFDPKQDQQLRQLGNLRNFFAHASKTVGTLAGETHIMPSRYGGELRWPEEEFTEFSRLHAEAKQYLDKVQAALLAAEEVTPEEH